MTVILAFVVLTVVFTAMSIGVLIGRKPITGSCGGVGAALGEKDYSCEICGDDPQKCEQQQDVKIREKGNTHNTTELFHQAK